LALLRRVRALRFFVRFDIGADPTRHPGSV